MFKMNMKKTIASILAATMAVSMLSTTVSAMTWTWTDPYGNTHVETFSPDEHDEVAAYIKAEKERMRKEIEEARSTSTEFYSDVTADTKLDKIAKMKYFGKEITFKKALGSDSAVISAIAYASAQGATQCNFTFTDAYKKNGLSAWEDREFDIIARKTYNVSNSTGVRIYKAKHCSFYNIDYATFIYAYRYGKTDLIKKMSKEDQQFYNKCVKILKECGVNDKNKTDAEKALAIRSWLYSNVSYEPGSSDIAKLAIINQKADCGGIAEAYKLLMRMSGYKCWTIVLWGIHSWNAVRINGELRYVDVTNAGSFAKDKLFFTYDEYKKASGFTPTMTKKELEMYCKY